jgi:hypothetical protein
VGYDYDVNITIVYNNNTDIGVNTARQRNDNMTHAGEREVVVRADEL